MQRLVFFNQYRKILNRILWALAFLILLLIATSYWLIELVNPFEFLIVQLGRTSIICFLLCYAISPVARLMARLCIILRYQFGKRVADWSFLYYQRRMLGLNSFYFAFCHMLVYLYFEIDLSVEEFYLEIQERTFIAIGSLAIFIGLVLAISSHNSIRRKLKRNWKKLHKLTHLLGALIIVHVVLVAKNLGIEEYAYLITLSCLAFERTYHILIAGSGSNKLLFKGRRKRQKYRK